MGLNVNQGSLGIGHHLEPPGPPFAATSADNGLSVDAITGRIVLGSDLGSPVPGQILSNREIDLNGNEIHFTNLAGDILLLDPTTGIYSIGDIAGTSGNNAYFEINDSIPEFSFRVGIGSRFLLIDQTISSIGDIDNFGNGLSYEINDANSQFIMRWQKGGIGTPVFFVDDTTSVYQMGDIQGLAGNGTFMNINDATNRMDLSNTALNAAYSINGNVGVSGTFAPPLSITVEGGIITNIT